MFKAPTIIKKENPKFTEIDSREASNLLAMLDDYDKKMLGYIIELHNASGRDIINVDKFENIIQALQHINAENEYDYLNSLLHPERCKGVKIPSPIPVPSCAFQLHNTITLSTNVLGNLVFIFNPFFLYSSIMHNTNYIPSSDNNGNVTINYCSSFLYNNNDVLDGRTATSVGWTTANIGQGIPNVYNQYRLVSASLVVRYIGRMDITSGVIGGAIVYDETVIPAINGTFNPAGGGDPGEFQIGQYNGLGKYANFDLAMDSFYHQENNCISGLREIYFPLDNTYEEYTKLITSVNNLDTHFFNGVYNQYRSFEGVGKNGFKQMVYVLGAPPQSACFKVDIYCNFETLPNAEFLNYMPISLTPKTVSPEVKKQSISIVQSRPITDLKTQQKWYGPNHGSLFSGLKKIWKSGIPKKAINFLAPYILPYFKPAISLFNMMESSTMGNTNNSFQRLNPNVKQLINNAEEDDGNPNMIMDNIE